MAKVTRALFGRLAARCTRAGGVPSLGGCAVLLSVAEYEVRGEQPPRQDIWAANLGMSERALRGHLGELRELWLVNWVRTGAGNEYSCNVPFVTRWARGDFDLVPSTARQILPEGDRQDLPEGDRQDLPEGQVRDRQDVPEGNGNIRRFSRAGYSPPPFPASPSPFPASPPAATTSPPAAALSDRADALRKHLSRKYRLTLSGIESELLSRLALGATEDWFDQAAHEATRDAAYTSRTKFMLMKIDGWLKDGHPDEVVGYRRSGVEEGMVDDDK